MFDDQASAIFAMVDPIAERVRKLGGTTLRSVAQVTRLQRIADNEADYVTPLDMLAELREDNARLADRMRELHGVCDEHGDVATASLLENWIDEAEQRAWFLFESTRGYTERLTGAVVKPIYALAARIAGALPLVLVAAIAVVAISVLVRAYRLGRGGRLLLDLARAATHVFEKGLEDGGVRTLEHGGALYEEYPGYPLPRAQDRQQTNYLDLMRALLKAGPTR